MPFFRAWRDRHSSALQLPSFQTLSQIPLECSRRTDKSTSPESPTFKQQRRSSRRRVGLLSSAVGSARVYLQMGYKVCYLACYGSYSKICGRRRCSIRILPDSLYVNEPHQNKSVALDIVMQHIALVSIGHFLKTARLLRTTSADHRLSRQRSALDFVRCPPRV